MTAHLLLPRFGALQLAGRCTASHSQFLSASINAASTCRPSAVGLIIGEAQHSGAQDSCAAVATSSTAQPSLDMLITPQHSSRVWPASTPGPATSSRSLASSPALLQEASRSASYRSPGWGRSAPCASLLLDGWLGGHFHHATATAAAHGSFSAASCPHRSLSTNASDTPFSAASGAVATAAALSGRSAAAGLGVGVAALTALARQSGVASASGRPHSGWPHAGHLTGLLATTRAEQNTLRSSSRSSGTISNSGFSSIISCAGARGNRGSSIAGSSSRREYGTGSWGGGGGGEPAGRGLPPPTIISPVPLRVVVVGWMGSNRRYLNKYGGLWVRSGDHEIVIIRPTVVQTLVRWRGVVVAGRDIDRVARLHRENPAMPTVYHIFSTGGFIHAGTMWRWMDEVEDVAQRRDLLEEVKGIILDSAPAAVNPEMAARAMVSAVTNTPAEELKYDMGGLQGALLGGTKAFLDSYLRSKGVQLRTEEVYDAWYNLAPVCPQLYLYSDADPLVPPADVERYMSVQEGRGVDVSSHKWADSGHVEHYRRHPHEYAYQVSAFLARALKDW